jgi:hypothetical protein
MPERAGRFGSAEERAGSDPVAEDGGDRRDGDGDRVHGILLR